MSRRNRIIELLQASDRALTAYHISIDLGIPEPTIERDLVHIAKSLRRRDEILLVRPPSCPECGFVFSPRRTSSPSRCPNCRATTIVPPAFTIGPHGSGNRRQNR